MLHRNAHAYDVTSCGCRPEMTGRGRGGRKWTLGMTGSGLRWGPFDKGKGGLKGWERKQPPSVSSLSVLISVII